MTQLATIFVGRKPIFDAERQVKAYELLFRSGDGNYCDTDDEDGATLEVLQVAFEDIGIDELTGGRRAFINFTKNLLINGTAELLPPEAVIVEILENIEPDDDVLDACHELKELGYTFALDDFIFSDRGSGFLNIVDIVKVDFMDSTVEERKEIAGDLQRLGIQALAEKVETVEEYEEAKRLGFSLFQGYFFAKPVIQQGKRIPKNKSLLLKMMCEISQPNISYDELEKTVRQDSGLTLKLLKLINSSHLGLRSHVDSVRQALMLLGPREIRKWIGLLALNGTRNSDKPHELTLQSMFYARAGELLASMVGDEQNASSLFLMGMLSTADAMLDVPMAQVVDSLPIDEDVCRALLGEECRYLSIYNVITYHQKANWSEFSRLCAELSLEETSVAQALLDARRWADQACAATASH